MKICSKCGETKPKTDFNKSKVNQDKLRGYCRECHAAYLASWRKKNPRRIRELFEKSRERNRSLILELKSSPCTDCDNRFPHYVMEYDHVRGKKKFNIGHYNNKSVKVLMEEIAKCELVCANCHRERTYRRLQQ